jgi:hypothetical protein
MRLSIISEQKETILYEQKRSERINYQPIVSFSFAIASVAFGADEVLGFGRPNKFMCVFWFCFAIGPIPPSNDISHHNYLLGAFQLTRSNRLIIWSQL